LSYARLAILWFLDRLVNAQHELASRKRRARDEGRDAEAEPLVGAWRDEIRMLRELVK
jgi:hypothetical protein